MLLRRREWLVVVLLLSAFSGSSVLWNGLLKYVAKQQLQPERKSISSGDIFPKIIWEAQSGQNRGLRVRIWGRQADSWGWGRFLAGSWDLGRLFDFGVDLRYFSFFRFEWF